MDKNKLYFLSIVGIVALVGIVAMVSMDGTSYTVADTADASDDTAIAGQATRVSRSSPTLMPGKVSAPDFSRESPGASLTKQCADILAGNPDHVSSILEQMRTDQSETLTAFMFTISVAELFIPPEHITGIHAQTLVTNYQDKVLGYMYDAYPDHDIYDYGSDVDWGAMWDVLNQESWLLRGESLFDVALGFVLDVMFGPGTSAAIQAGVDLFFDLFEIWSDAGMSFSEKLKASGEVIAGAVSETASGLWGIVEDVFEAVDELFDDKQSGDKESTQNAESTQNTGSTENPKSDGEGTPDGNSDGSKEAEECWPRLPHPGDWGPEPKSDTVGDVIGTVLGESGSGDDGTILTTGELGDIFGEGENTDDFVNLLYQMFGVKINSYDALPDEYKIIFAAATSDRYMNELIAECGMKSPIVNELITYRALVQPLGASLNSNAFQASLVEKYCKVALAN